MFFCDVRETGPAGRGVGGKVNLPPSKQVLNTPTKGRRILGSLWDYFGITLGSLWVTLGSLWGHFGVTLGHFGVTLGPGHHTTISVFLLVEEGYHTTLSNSLQVVK